MKLLKTVIINKPVKQVWKVAAEDFAHAGQWMTGVFHSSEFGKSDIEHAPCSGRVCVLENKTNGLKAEENILKFDAQNHTLVFEVIPVKEGGTGLPLTKNTVTLKLDQVNENQTKVFWYCDFEVTRIGKLLSPLLRIGVGFAFKGILNDLKVFVETGTPSKRKQKFNEKNINQPLVNN